MVQLSKAYLRYEAGAQFGVIQSTNCNLLLSGCGKYLFTCCNERIVCWSLKKSEAVFSFDVNTNVPVNHDSATLLVSVTRLGWLRDGHLLVAGYADGTVRVWELSLNTASAVDRGYDTFDLKPPKLKVTFHGHKNQVSCLGFNIQHDAATRAKNSGSGAALARQQEQHQSGAASSSAVATSSAAAGAAASQQLLASGGFDTDIVVWDALAEAGVCRLRGHRDRVTGLSFLSADRVVSCAKDRCVKLWDVATQVCLQTIAERAELWSLCAIQADEVCPGKQLVAVGGGDHLLRLYQLGETPSSKTNAASSSKGEIISATSSKNENNYSDYRLAEWGQLQREITNAACSSLQLVKLANEGGRLLVCQSNGKTLEAFRLHDEKEIDKRRKRRRKRAQEKQKKKANASNTNVLAVDEDALLAAGAAAEEHLDKTQAAMQPTDAFTRLPVYRVPAKLHGMAWAQGRCALGLASNSVQVLDNVQLPELSATEDLNRLTPLVVEKAFALERPGHRNCIRAVAVSPDDMLILSLAAESIKIWSTQTHQCLQTLPSGYGLCGFFLPGNTHVLIATKTGDLELYDLGAGVLTQKHSLSAEGRALYALAPTPGETGFCVGGADRQVTFFEWVYYTQSDLGTSSSSDNISAKKKQKKQSKQPDANAERKILQFRKVAAQLQNLDPTEEEVDDPENKEGRAGKNSGVEAGTTSSKQSSLDMPDDVMALAYGKDWLAVGMLDNNVSIYYGDSRKHNLSLYGHQLPVLCVDLTSDQQMVASGSADKTIKLWSTRFGNCHKSLRAHEDSVMCVRFVRETHYLVSCGKDKAVKTWDCDTYELIANLGYHTGEVWGMGLSYDGAFLVTGGEDRALRFWRRTEQQFFAHEEREKELEQQMEQEAVRDDFGAGTVENLRPTRKNLEVIKTTDKLMEILDRADENVKMGLDKTRQTAIVKSVNTLLPANIYEVLLALPFSHSLDILETVARLLGSLLEEQGTTSRTSDGVEESYKADSGRRAQEEGKNPKQLVAENIKGKNYSKGDTTSCCTKQHQLSLLTETTIRATLILIHVHSKQLGQNAEYVELLIKLRDGIRSFVQRHMENVGVNAAAMEFFLEEMKFSQGTGNFFGARGPTSTGTNKRTGGKEAYARGNSTKKMKAK
ncbi:unnamed protein product [Amoebophrya sp. A120]|nr:unnamed protein product [Amoebophrya sp. A120]|eukprot:GSA120T00017527001.1